MESADLEIIAENVKTYITKYVYDKFKMPRIEALKRMALYLSSL